jgi:energy-coupling factor transport system ATP-binding protein
MKRHCESIIELTNVTYAHGPKADPCLRQVSLTIPQGQWVSIAGANGSGKSTLVKLLCGLLPLSSGHIEIDGIEMSGENVHKIRERVGIIFQNPDNQFVGLTVEDDIVFGLENRCLDREEMKERLHRYAERLQVADLLDRHPSQLSGGQKQRAAIAAVLAMEPKIVIFDEATSMLDERSKQELIGIMKVMVQSGRYTVINVTHDLGEMLASDRMVALSGGTIAADGSPQDLLKDDALLERCRLKPPFALQLSRELRKRGLALAESLNESEVLEALCAFNSTR